MQSGSSASNVGCVKSKGDDYQEKSSPRKNVEWNIEIKKRGLEVKEQLNNDVSSEDRNNAFFDNTEILTQIP